MKIGKRQEEVHMPCLAVVFIHIKEMRTSWILCDLGYVSDIKTNILTCDYLSATETIHLNQIMCIKLQ